MSTTLVSKRMLNENAVICKTLTLDRLSLRWIEVGPFRLIASFVAWTDSSPKSKLNRGMKTPSAVPKTVAPKCRKI